MRYVLIGLGVITLALGVVLAWETLWWAAIPDAGFGIGVAWIAWASLRHDAEFGPPERERALEQPATVAVTVPPEPEPSPEPPAAVASPAPAPRSPAPPLPAAAPAAAPRGPARRKKRRK